MGTFNNWVFFQNSQNSKPDMNITALMQLLYKTLDTLYIETRDKLPLKPTRKINKKPHVEPDRITFHLWLSDPDYTALRSILALVGDLYNTSRMLMGVTGLAGLQQHVVDINNESDKFRDARNFFTHMDDHLGNRQTHGVSGPNTLGCGVQFTANAVNNAYLIWENNTLYFNRKHDFCEVVIDRPAFTRIFDHARELYAEIHNNPISQQNVTIIPPNEIYPPT